MDSNDNSSDSTDLGDFADYEPPWRDPDRDRGILTPSDRRYLLGEVELEGQDERNARYRIRQRVKESLQDMVLIAEEMEERDIDHIADSDVFGDEFVRLLLTRSSIMIMYKLIKSRNRDRSPTELLERSVEEAVAGEAEDKSWPMELKLADDWEITSANVEINIYSFSAEDMRKQLAELSDDELESLENQLTEGINHVPVGEIINILNEVHED